jgi:hypothetical protein
MSTQNSKGRDESAEALRESNLDATARRKAERSRIRAKEAAFRRDGVIVSRPNRRRRPPTSRELFMQIAHEKISIKDERRVREVTRIQAVMISLFQAPFHNVASAKYLAQLFELLEREAPESDEAKLARLDREAYRKGGSMFRPEAIREIVDSPEASEIDYDSLAFEDDGSVDEFSTDSDQETFEVPTEPERPREEE